MAKKKKATERPKPDTNQEWAALIPQIRQHFALEIDHLLSEVPADLWEEPETCGLVYEFLPWHQYSSLAIQLRDDDPNDIGGWTHYECVNPDGRHVTDEFAIYEQANDGLVYHRLLIETAEALLATDFTRFGQDETTDDGYLNRLFRLQVYHHDENFKFNYCEYVLARRLEQNNAG
jgi:hypothetical protein